MTEEKLKEGNRLNKFITRIEKMKTALDTGQASILFKSNSLNEVRNDEFYLTYFPIEIQKDIIRHISGKMEEHLMTLDKKFEEL